MNKEIEVSLTQLKLFIEKENYRGYDPYDALQSPFLNLPLIKGNKTIRFLSQQLVKRFPVNIRPLLLIKKGLNPVTLGLCIQGYVNMGISGLISRDETEGKCSALMNNLESLMAQGYSGACWGENLRLKPTINFLPLSIYRSLMISS